MSIIKKAAPSYLRTRTFDCLARSFSKAASVANADSPSSKTTRLKRLTRIWSDLPDRINIVDNGAIQTVLKYVSDDLATDKSAFLECSPGAGFLSEALLEAGLPKLHTLETPGSEYFSLLTVGLVLNKSNDLI